MSLDVLRALFFDGCFARRARAGSLAAAPFISAQVALVMAAFWKISR